METGDWCNRLVLARPDEPPSADLVVRIRHALCNANRWRNVNRSGPRQRPKNHTVERPADADGGPALVLCANDLVRMVPGHCLARMDKSSENNSYDVCCRNVHLRQGPHPNTDAHDRPQHWFLWRQRRFIYDYEGWGPPGG